MTEEVAAATEGKPRVAIVDDALVAISMSLVPDDEQAEVGKILLSEPAAGEISRLGLVYDPSDLASFVEVMSDPSVDAESLRSMVQRGSSRLSDLLSSRRAMRRIVAAMSRAFGGDVHIFGPDVDAATRLPGFDLVFLDYNLDPTKDGGERALEIAGDLAGAATDDSAALRQIVLMSSDSRVRNDRISFRKRARLSGTSFAFVDKSDLDQSWKVRSHADVLNRSAPVSAALSSYLDALKTAMSQAATVLDETIDDLDLGDFAYIQRMALRADGHPLGDYLTWLLSSHVTRVVFEGGLRDTQFAVDRLKWGAEPLSQTTPSTKIASLYHDAVFSARQGPLVSHPLAEAGTPYHGIPMVQLGDVFFDRARSKAVVVMSAACDLAFAPDPERPPDPERAVILVQGKPDLLHVGTESKWNTRGVLHGGNVYQIDWNFRSYRTETLGELRDYLERNGFAVDDRERLRPLYALKLQQEFGAYITRVGPPVMAPISRPMSAFVVVCKEDGAERLDLEDGEIVATYHAEGTTVRLTTRVVGLLQTAAEMLLLDREGVRDDLASQVDADAKAAAARAKRIRELGAKIVASRAQIENDELWIALASDQVLPKHGNQTSLKGGIRLQHGGPDLADAKAGIVLVIDEKSQERPRRGDQAGNRQQSDAAADDQFGSALPAGTPARTNSVAAGDSPWRSTKK